MVPSCSPSKYRPQVLETEGQHLTHYLTHRATDRNSERHVQTSHGILRLPPTMCLAHWHHLEMLLCCPQRYYYWANLGPQCCYFYSTLPRIANSSSATHDQWKFHRSSRARNRTSNAASQRRSRPLTVPQYASALVSATHRLATCDRQHQLLLLPSNAGT